MARAAFTLLRDENIAAVNAVDRDGRIIASSLPEICGLHAQPRTMAPQLAQVFAGRTHFIRPYVADSRLVAAQPFLGTRPLAWIETPVRDAAGNVVAALGFASYVDRDFESILSAARPGRNRRGLCIRRNRHVAVRCPRRARVASCRDTARGRQGCRLPP